MLPQTWSVGLVLMNQNTPDNLKTDEPNLEADITRLANRFGSRLIVTDRFAVTVILAPARTRLALWPANSASALKPISTSSPPKKQFVEPRALPPISESYTAVYRDDGLLDHHCICAPLHPPSDLRRNGL